MTKCNSLLKKLDFFCFVYQTSPTFLTSWFRKDGGCYSIGGEIWSFLVRSLEISRLHHYGPIFGLHCFFLFCSTWRHGISLSTLYRRRMFWPGLSAGNCSETLSISHLRNISSQPFQQNYLVCYCTYKI